MGGPEGLNTQAHSEQPHPTTLCSLIHTFLRDELSWPEVGIQHLTSGQRKVRHAPLPNRTKAEPASIHDFFSKRIPSRNGSVPRPGLINRSSPRDGARAPMHGTSRRVWVGSSGTPSIRLANAGRDAWQTPSTLSLNVMCALAGDAGESAWDRLGS